MKRITIIGLAALCALALAAVGAATASAEVPTTAWTCVKGATGGQGKTFTDPDCITEKAGGGGEYGHQAIPANTSTQLTLKQIVPAKFTTVIAGASVTLEAAEIECMACMGENQEPTAGNMRVFGEGGTIVFKGVTVASAPTKCKVSGTVTGVTTAGSVETKPLKVETVATGEAKIYPASTAVEPPLAEFKIEAQAGQTCIPASTVVVKGDANGTIKGAVLAINVPSSSKTLTVGVNGAALSGEATVSVGNTPTEKEPNPVHTPATLT